MNAIRIQSNSHLYSNTVTIKRNFYPGSSKKFYKNYEKNQESSEKINSGKRINHKSTVDSIVELFSGTIVKSYTSGIEWGTTYITSGQLINRF